MSGWSIERTASEVAETMAAAVVSVLHSLMEIASDRTVSTEERIEVACLVLDYAFDGGNGVREAADTDEEDDEADEAEESEESDGDE